LIFRSNVSFPGGGNADWNHWKWKSWKKLWVHGCEDRFSPAFCIAQSNARHGAAQMAGYGAKSRRPPHLSRSARLSCWRFLLTKIGNALEPAPRTPRRENVVDATNPISPDHGSRYRAYAFRGGRDRQQISHRKGRQGIQRRLCGSLRRPEGAIDGRAITIFFAGDNSHAKALSGR